MVIIKKTGLGAAANEYWNGTTWTRRKDCAAQIEPAQAMAVCRKRLWRYAERLVLIRASFGTKDRSFENRRGI